ncbi:MAG TPA: hypothetical protein VK041_09865, partial [Opitutales bacterium]|nr:hypothetical protein [Opitutales bacterium]
KLHLPESFTVAKCRCCAGSKSKFATSPTVSDWESEDYQSFGQIGTAVAKKGVSSINWQSRSVDYLANLQPYIL